MSSGPEAVACTVLGRSLLATLTCVIAGRTFVSLLFRGTGTRIVHPTSSSSGDGVGVPMVAHVNGDRIRPTILESIVRNRLCRHFHDGTRLGLQAWKAIGDQVWRYKRVAVVGR